MRSEPLLNQLNFSCFINVIVFIPLGIYNIHNKQLGLLFIGIGLIMLLMGLIVTPFTCKCKNICKNNKQPNINQDNINQDNNKQVFLQV